MWNESTDNSKLFLYFIVKVHETIWKCMQINISKFVCLMGNASIPQARQIKEFSEMLKSASLLFLISTLQNAVEIIIQSVKGKLKK